LARLDTINHFRHEQNKTVRRNLLVFVGVFSAVPSVCHSNAPPFFVNLTGFDIRETALNRRPDRLQEDENVQG
jgi:hypothetical protein